MSELENKIPDRLKAVQTAFGINTYPALAEVCGTSASVVGNWMSGINSPRVPEMARLCDRTGVTLDWIYRGLMVTMDNKLSFHLAKIMVEGDRAPSTAISG